MGRNSGGFLKKENCNLVFLKKGKGSGFTHPPLVMEVALVSAFHLHDCLCVVSLRFILRRLPWPKAQSEIRTISAYKTPGTKCSAS